MRYPASPPPLSDKDAYTTWPGGVDPTARVYSSVGGGHAGRRARLAAKSPRKSALKRRQTPKRRRSTRKSSRKHRKANRRNTRRY